MKKIFSIAAMLLFVCVSAGAQKFALVDMEYILNRIPAYERANEQLNQFSKRWQAEVEALNLEAQTLYKNYQNESLFLSEEQKAKKEEEIVAKEKQASDLKRQYFGPDGELYKKQESLMSPIQDEIYGTETTGSDSTPSPAAAAKKTIPKNQDLNVLISKRLAFGGHLPKNTSIPKRITPWN